MGKSVGFIGPISGKIGTIVFYYRDGKQNQRVYVPNPNNPKSAAQQATRLKLSLAGKLSSIVPAEALEGMPGGSRTQRRSRFLKDVIGMASVSDGKAMIAEEDILFSEGALGVLPGHSVAAGTSAVGRRSVNITTHMLSGTVVPEGYGERYVVLMLNGITSQFDYAETGVIDIPEAGASTTTLVNVRVGDQTSPYTALVYVYPYESPGAGGGRFRVSDLGTGDGTVFVDSETGELVSSGLVYGRSILVGRVDIQPPQTMSREKKVKGEM